MKSLDVVQMMKYYTRALLLVVVLAFPLSTFGQWQAKVGAQSPDCLVGGDSDLKLASGCQAYQAMAFIPNRFGFIRTTASPGRALPTKVTRSPSCINRSQRRWVRRLTRRLSSASRTRWVARRTVVRQHPTTRRMTRQGLRAYSAYTAARLRLTVTPTPSSSRPRATSSLPA